MGRPRRIIGLALALTAVAAPAAAAPVKPHLVPLLPTTVFPDGQQAPVFVDTLEQPGRVLYRFDSVLWNQGGALDMFAPAPSSAGGPNDVKQVIWNNGIPTAEPQDPNATPTTTADANVEDRSALHPTASIDYNATTGHHHWHFLQAAEYSLIVPGAPARGSGKSVGFCLVDSYGPFTAGAPSFFPEGYTGGNTDTSRTWCQYFQSPADGGADPPVVRMGISPGWGDYYESQDAGQWIDVTGLTPGTYTLTATANPNGFIDTDPPTNGDDRVSAERVIPGVTATAASASAVSGQAAAVPLSGAIVGPEVPARASATGPCSDENLEPTTPLALCYRTADPAGPLSFAVATPPAHGTVAIGAAAGLGATATYTPAGGYAGPDAFTYVATDARGLTSAPATVSLIVSPAPTIVIATLRPRIAVPRRLSGVKRLAVHVRFGRTVCGARVEIVGSRLTRHPAPYHTLAARRVGCARQVHLVARRPRPGVWRIRAVVLLSGRSFVSSVHRVIVSAPKATGPDKAG